MGPVGCSAGSAPGLVRSTSARVLAKVLAVAVKVKTAQLGLGLAHEVAFTEEHLVVVPPDSFPDGSVAPAHDGSSGAPNLCRERFDRYDLEDCALAHGVIVRDAKIDVGLAWAGFLSMTAP